MKTKLNFQILVGFLLVGLVLSGCSAAKPAQGAVNPSPVVPTKPLPTQQPTQQPTPQPTSLPTATPEVDCIIGEDPSFADYKTWTRLNGQPISGHEKFVYVYVNELAKETYLSASGEPFPVCAKIVKEHLVSQNSQTVSEMTIMIKMPAGFDPEHNDWWWGLYDAAGKNAMMSGKVQVCIACHEPQADQDYVFSKEVLAASGK